MHGVDLHTHSNISDGTFSPQQLVEAAVEKLVHTLALTDHDTRLQQLEKANLEALSQNQELQLKNDNLGVQVQVLQSERSAQMFLYGAATLAVGVLLGFLIASYVYTKRRRQW
jgi:predicted metal-dependent phosphoesterase TrpH